MILPLIVFIGLGVAVEKYAGPPEVKDLPMYDLEEKVLEEKVLEEVFDCLEEESIVSKCEA